MNKKKVSFFRGIVEVYDANAEEFIVAANITDNTQKKAITKLVIALKSYGIWSKLKAVYPFVGGNSSSHKFNLKDPRDLDIAFRLSFFGGITHSINGILPNGTNGYANTFFIPNSNITLNSEHLMLYSTTNNIPLTSDSIDIGVYESNLKASNMSIRGTSTKDKFQSRLNSTAVITQNTDAKGMYLVTKNGDTILNLYKNGELLNNSISSGSLAINPVYIGNLRLISTTYTNGWSNQNYAFASIGDGLNATEQLNYYNAVQSYQTELGRNV